MSKKISTPQYEFPCAHCDCLGQCSEEPHSESCSYEICSREELVKRIFIAEEYAESETERRELTNMWVAFTHKYLGYRYDIYRYGLHHQVCQACDGTGTCVDADGISSCKQCNGTRVVDKPGDPNMTTLWFVLKRRHSDPDVLPKDLEFLYTSEDAAKRAVKECRDKQCEAGELVISKNLIDLTEDGYSSTHEVIDTKSLLKNIIALGTNMIEESNNYQITGFGSWAEFHKTAYGYIAPYLDIDQVSSGNVTLIRMDKMNQMMTIKTKESTNALYWNLLMNTIMVYCNTYVTYSGADELLTKYCGSKGICKNWEELRSNILKHVTTNNAGKVTDNAGKQLAEAVQMDFQQYGITIPIIDAFGVVEKLSSIMGESNVALNIGTRKCDALVVFMIEYICISPDAEFTNITSEEDK